MLTLDIAEHPWAQWTPEPPVAASAASETLRVSEGWTGLSEPPSKLQPLEAIPALHSVLCFFLKAS